MSVAYVPLDENGAPITMRWDTDAGECCKITREGPERRLATWTIVDAAGTPLRSGTWRVEHREEA